MSYLTLIDLFGYSPSFYITSNRTYQSKLGSVFTIVYFILIFTASFLFGKDFYLKLSPKVIDSKVVNTEYKNITIDNSNFKLAFRLEDYVGTFLESNLFKIEAYYIMLDILNNNQITKNISVISDCNLTDIKSDYNPENARAYCLSLDSPLLFGGDWSADFLNYFIVMVSPNPDIKNASHLIIDLPDGISFNYYYNDYVFIANDFENPIQIKFTNKFYYLNPFSLRKDKIYYASQILNNDNGWIFASTNLDEKYIQQHVISDYYSLDLTFQDRFNYYFAEIYYSTDYRSINRSYMKIQELVAYVGGIMKALFVAIQIVMVFYNNFLMELTLIKALYDQNEVKSAIFKRQLIDLETKAKKDKTRTIAAPLETKSGRLILKSMEAPQFFIHKTENILKETEYRKGKEYKVSFIMNVFSCLLTKNKDLKKFLFEKSILRRKLDIAYYLNLTNYFFYIKELVSNKLLNDKEEEVLKKNNPNINIIGNKRKLNKGSKKRHKYIISTNAKGKNILLENSIAKENKL